MYRPFKGGGLSKPRPRVQRAAGPRLLRDHLRPARPEPGSLKPKSSTLTTRLSRHPYITSWIYINKQQVCNKLANSPSTGKLRGNGCNGFWASTCSCLCENLHQKWLDHRRQRRKGPDTTIFHLQGSISQCVGPPITPNTITPTTHYFHQRNWLCGWCRRRTSL